MEQDQVRQAVADWLETYRPRAIPDPDWDASGLREFVAHQIVRLDPPSVGQAQKRALELAQIGYWCLKQGMDLDVEDVLDPDTVERYCLVGLKGDPSAGDYRSRLRRLGRALTIRAPWEPAPEPLKRRSLAPPYMPVEVGRLKRDADRQATELRERAFQVLLALGLGAGLDGRWTGQVRGSDVRASSGVILIDVPDPCARPVPVLAEWEDEVSRLAIQAGPGLLLGGEPNKNLVSNRINQLELGKDSPALASNRLRSTWLLAHIELGTRLPELAAAAGMQGVTALSDLLPLATLLGDPAAWRALRGR